MHCPSCSIDYRGDLDRCPLCGSALTGTPSDSSFPALRREASTSKARFLLAAFTVVCLAATFILGVIIGLSFAVIWGIVGALALNYLFVRNVVLHTPDFIRIIERYFLVLIAMAIIAWAVTQEEAIPTFIIPSISLTGILFDAILLLLFRNSFVLNHAKYLLYDIVLGFLPLCFFMLGTVTWAGLVIADALVALFLAIGLLAFTRAQTSEELRKLFSLR